MKSNFIFVGMLLASLFCGSFVVLAKENGTEECDAVQIEKVLKQARAITASATFLSEITPLMEEVKAEVKKTMPELILTPTPNQEQDVFERKEYNEAVRHYFGKNSRPKLKND